MATFVVLRHYVTTLVTDFTNPNNLNNDLLILNSWITICLLSFIWKQESTKWRSYDLESDPYAQNRRAELGTQKVLLMKP